MRILQIVHGFPPELIAGTEQYCEALTQHLMQRGYECMVLAGSERSAPEPTLATVDQGGLLVTRYLRAEGRPRRWTEEYDAEADGMARRLLSLVQPDIVHLHHWQRLTNNLVAICADQGIPVVVTLHDVWTSCPRIHRIRWDGAFCAEPPTTAPCLSCAHRGPWQGDREIGAALALRQEMMDTELALAAAIIAPSEAHRAFLVDLLDVPKDRVTVLPHGTIATDTTRQRGEESVAFPDRPLQVGHWGYLVYPKGTHLLLEAVRQLRDPSSVEVHLIGTLTDQKYEERLRELARGISVRFHGAYRPADLETFDLDLAVFPSIASESYSFTLDEALRLGLPVLVSDRGAFPERIGTAGRTFEAGDAGDLAVRLQEILDRPEVLETMRRGIRPESLFSMEAHVAMMEKIYDGAAHDNTARREPHTPYLKLIAHAQRQVTDREEALAGLQGRLQEAEEAMREKETRLQEQDTRLQEQDTRLRESRDRLQEAEEAMHEKEVRLQEQDARLEETRRALDRLQEEHADLRGYVERLKQTPLFKLQKLLEKLSKRP